jgi:poly(A) polymerase Pap1
LKAGEWYFYKDRYFLNWVLKFKEIKDTKIFTYKSYCMGSGYKTNDVEYFSDLPLVSPIRHATREEIIKYFPHEFEINSHGGNDIPQVTDPHI